MTAATETRALRLADAAHPARGQLDAAIEIIDRMVEVVLLGERTGMRLNGLVDDIGRAIASLDEAIAMQPLDMDLQVAKAGLLHAAGKPEQAQAVLDLVLEREPGHFEAAAWSHHFDSWSDALRYPRWDEGTQSLHPVMLEHLRHEQRVQLVRDGLQKAVAIVTGIQGPPLHPQTELKVAWVLSKTPYGPLVAYYVRLREPSDEPSTMEAFLPIFGPAVVWPSTGYYLVQQLAFTPYCYVVLAGDEGVMLNRRLVFGPELTRQVRSIASDSAAAAKYLVEKDFQAAQQWHMNHFDMATLAFE